MAEGSPFYSEMAPWEMRASFPGRVTWWGEGGEERGWSESLRRREGLSREQRRAAGGQGGGMSFRGTTWVAGGAGQGP